jgi:hypothetical protein
MSDSLCSLFFILTLFAQNGNGLCYIVCMLIIAILGMVLGQIRTLQRFGWLANFAVWTTGKLEKYANPR